MINISVSEEIKSIAPQFLGVAIIADVKNTPFDENLWNEIHTLWNKLSSELTNESIKNNAAIKATRDVYKALGKDANRYRPSAEALLRRITKNQELYKINTLVDLINLFSIQTGYSIGGFDYNKIQGNTLILGAGKNGEAFQAIGRGPLNIEGLPVYRDQIGGIGTPTSDEERTKLDLSTTKLLMLINAYDGKTDLLNKTIENTKDLLLKYASAKNITIFEY